MQTLLAAATELEIAPFIEKNPSADILITGVGSPATIYHLTKRIQLIDYDLVIQAGIAGSFDHTIQLGTVVLVKEDTFADVGIKTVAGLSTIFEEGFADKDQPPYINGWLKNTNGLLDSLAYPQVTGITINTITDNREDIMRQAAKFHPQIETMEGAALHYVCLMEEVPFLQIRSLSNYIGERDKSKWNMKAAIQQLNKELQGLYERMAHGEVKSLE